MHPVKADTRIRRLRRFGSGTSFDIVVYALWWSCTTDLYAGLPMQVQAIHLWAALVLCLLLCWSHAVVLPRLVWQSTQSLPAIGACLRDLLACTAALLSGLAAGLVAGVVIVSVGVTASLLDLLPSAVPGFAIVMLAVLCGVFAGGALCSCLASHMTRARLPALVPHRAVHLVAGLSALILVCGFMMTGLAGGLEGYICACVPSLLALIWSSARQSRSAIL